MKLPCATIHKVKIVTLVSLISLFASPLVLAQTTTIDELPPDPTATDTSSTDLTPDTLPPATSDETTTTPSDETVPPVDETTTPVETAPPAAPEIIADNPTQLFPDLSQGSEYYVGVKYLKNLGLIQGYPDGLFRPSQQINRAEALKILVGAINYSEFSPVEKPLASLQSTPDVSEAINCPFPDLENNAWYFSFVCSAYENKIVEGYPDGTFKPAQTINKVEALKIALLHSGIPLETTYTDNFDDISPADWFWDYARIADEHTIIVSDRQGNLTPAENLNRGDFSMLVYRLLRSIENHSEFGRATYYGGRFDGLSTASGETFNTNLPTAAHKTLPFGTIVRVTNLHNGKQVDVRINDRGPYVNGTIIDLSNSAFASIASLSTGVVQSEVEIISHP